jgi:hypothetical protein
MMREVTVRLVLDGGAGAWPTDEQLRAAITTALEGRTVWATGNPAEEVVAALREGRDLNAVVVDEAHVVGLDPLPDGVPRMTG